MLDGAVGVPVYEDVYPNEVVPPAASWLFQLADFTVASDPACVSVPFQALLMVSPSGMTTVTVQPCIVEVVGLETVTCAWKPPGQALTTE